MPYDGKVPERPKARWRRHGEEGQLRKGETIRERAKRLNQRYSRTSLNLTEEEWERFQAYVAVNGDGKKAASVLRDLVMNEVSEYEEGQE